MNGIFLYVLYLRKDKRGKLSDIFLHVYMYLGMDVFLRYDLSFQ